MSGAAPAARAVAPGAVPAALGPLLAGYLADRGIAARRLLALGDGAAALAAAVAAALPPDPARRIVARAPYDVVVGLAPWHWSPRRLEARGPGRPVPLTEDPALVALLEATADAKTGLLVVGPGFLMRPGPGTAARNLGRLGLALELVAELPRGMFLPDSGSGRLVVGLGRAPGRPLVAMRPRLHP